MFGVIDVNAVLLGALFGLILSAAIVLFLIYAAINAPQTEGERTRQARFGAWRPIAKYEGRRTHLYLGNHDPDFEW
ncbi:MAG TPA: hypothetical protein VKY59_10520 [Spirillospora sp.]|nr:hypothetical protein [Spirillospora sp.]